MIRGHWLIVGLSVMGACWGLCAFFDGVVYAVAYSDAVWRLSERWGLGW